jgi:hypothetical protein
MDEEECRRFLHSPSTSTSPSVSPSTSRSGLTSPSSTDDAYHSTPPPQTPRHRRRCTSGSYGCDERDSGQKTLGLGLDLTGLGNYARDMELLSPEWWGTVGYEITERKACTHGVSSGLSLTPKRQRIRLENSDSSTSVTRNGGLEGAHHRASLSITLSTCPGLRSDAAQPMDNGGGLSDVLLGQRPQTDNAAVPDNIRPMHEALSRSASPSSAGTAPSPPGSPSSSYTPSSASTTPRQQIRTTTLCRTPDVGSSTPTRSCRLELLRPPDFSDLSPTPSLTYDTVPASQGSQSSAILRTPSTPFRSTAPRLWRPSSSPTTPTKPRTPKSGPSVFRTSHSVALSPALLAPPESQHRTGTRVTQLHHVSSDGGPIQALQRFLEARKVDPSLAGFSLFLHCPKKRVRRSKSEWTKRHLVIIQGWNALMATIRMCLAQPVPFAELIGQHPPKEPVCE